MIKNWFKLGFVVVVVIMVDVVVVEDVIILWINWLFVG